MDMPVRERNPQGGSCVFGSVSRKADPNKHVRLNELGRRIGESHPRSKLADDEIELVLSLIDDGMSYSQVAQKMDVSKSCIAHIADGTNRGQCVHEIRRKA